MQPYQLLQNKPPQNVGSRPLVPGHRDGRDGSRNPSEGTGCEVPGRKSRSTEGPEEEGAPREEGAAAGRWGKEPVPRVGTRRGRRSCPGGGSGEATHVPTPIATCLSCPTLCVDDHVSQQESSGRCAFPPASLLASQLR